MRFRKKLLLFQVSVIALLAVVIGVVLAGFFRESVPRMLQDVANRTRFCVRTLSVTVDVGIAADDRPLLERHLHRCASAGDELDTDFRFAAVLDAHGNVLASLGDFPRHFAPAATGPSLVEIDLDGAFRAGAAVVFEGKLLGSVWAEFTTDSVTAARRMFLLSAVVGLIVVLFLFAISVVFIYRLVRPLNTMIDFVHQVAAGHQTVPLDVQASDEMAVLAEDLNKMSVEIRHRLDVEEALFLTSKQFAAPEGTDLDEVLRILGEILRASRAYVFSYLADDQAIRLKNHWRMPGTEHVEFDFSSDFDLSGFPWSIATLAQGDIIDIQGPESLPEEAAAERALLGSLDIRATVVVPIRSRENDLVGLMAFVAKDVRETFLWEDKQVMRVTAEMIGTFWERQSTEAQLKASEERFRILFEFAPDAYYLNDMEGRFLDGNRAAEEMIGYKKEELIGKNFMEIGILPEEELPTAAEAFMRNLEGEPADLPALTMVRKDGSRAVVEVRAIPVQVGGQSVVLGLARNVTARVRAERDNRELEQRLRQAQKMEAVGQLAGGVAHEINNPLGVILGFAQSVSKRLRPDDPLSLPLRSIEREALRCKKLVSDLLAFSRRSSNQKEATEVTTLIDATSALVQHQAKVKSIRFLVHNQAQGAVVQADFNQLQQVLVNLATNAMDAMPDGGTLRFESERADSSVFIRVSDTGQGMPPDVRERIFEPFFTTKEVGKGTGLGLSLVYETIKQHDGTIEVLSQEGKGTTFIISLPVVATELRAETHDG